jgi:hypothetical protein
VYAAAGLLLVIVLFFGLRVFFAAFAPQLQGWSMTLAWIVTSLVAVAWYATRDEDSSP